MSTLLRYEEAAGDIYKKLKQIPRTGWVIRGVKDPETVYDHTIALLKLAEEIGMEAKLSSLEIDDLKHILEIHDWAEALVGDEYIPNEDSEAYEERKTAKAIHERSALAELLDNKPYAEVVTLLFDRYEKGSDAIAKLAKEVDKYQALELALQYEEEQNIPLFSEFYAYYKRDWPFSHPIIISRIEALRDRHKDIIHEN